MTKTPFNEKELVVVRELPGFHGSAPKTVYDQPANFRENWIATLRDKEPWYLASALDFKNICPRISPDLRAKSMVTDAEGRYRYEGVETDFFGAEWIYLPASGAIEREGYRMMDDIEDWEDVLVFPNMDEWDWEAASAANKEYQSDPLFCPKTIMVTGYFERLISFVGFEDALICMAECMVDEDVAESVHKLFQKLTDFYCDYIRRMAKYFDIALLELHDDWGHQHAAMFSPETHREMILPYIKQITAQCHELGILYEQHSCGMVETIIPQMIEAGIDLWMGQPCNDKAMLVREYGDKICIGCELPMLPPEATDEEIHEAAVEWAATYLIPGKPCALSIEAAKNPNRDRFERELYVLSRKAFCGEE